MQFYERTLKTTAINRRTEPLQQDDTADSNGGTGRRLLSIKSKSDSVFHGDTVLKMGLPESSPYLRGLRRMRFEGVANTFPPFPPPTTPTSPTSPTTPTSPTSPVDPTTPESPVDPTTPESPVDPTTPESPVDPTTPESPVDPTTPESPVEPTTPESPVEPTTPEEPTQEEGEIDLEEIMEIVMIVAACIMALRTIWAILKTIDQAHERYLSESQDLKDDQMKDFKRFQYSMCSEMVKLAKMFDAVQEVDNEMMSGLYQSCGKLLVPRDRLMRRSVIDLAVSYRNQEDSKASFEVNTLNKIPTEEEKLVEGSLKSKGYERLNIDVHHKVESDLKTKSERDYCKAGETILPGTFLWVRHGYGDAITDVQISQCGFAYQNFDHQYGTCDTSLSVLKKDFDDISGSKLKMSSYFDDDKNTLHVDENDLKDIGGCALCDPEFKTSAKHRTWAQAAFDTVMTPISFGTTVGKAILYGVEWGYYKIRYQRNSFKWNDFGKNQMFQAPIVTIYPDENAEEMAGGVATGKCMAYHDCKYRDFQFVPRWKSRKENPMNDKRMSMGQNYMTQSTPTDLHTLLDSTMFRKYPMSLLENWVAADNVDFIPIADPKTSAFDYDVADFTQCHHTKWASNTMKFKRGTSSRGKNFSTLKREARERLFLSLFLSASLHLSRYVTHTHTHTYPQLL